MAMTAVSYRPIEIGLGLFGVLVYFLLDYCITLLQLLGVEITRYEEAIIVQDTSIAELVLAVLMLIGGFIWMFLLRNKASLRYRISLIAIYCIPMVHLIYFLVLVFSRHIP